MIRTRSEKTSFSIVPLSSSTSRKGDFCDALGHEPGRERERCVDTGDVGSDEGAGELTRQRDEHEGRSRCGRQAREGKVEVESGRGEEQRDEETLRGAAHAGHDVVAHPLGQPGQGGTEQQRPDSAVQAHLLRHREQPSDQQAERELGNVEDSLQSRPAAPCRGQASTTKAMILPSRTHGDRVPGVAVLVDREAEARRSAAMIGHRLLEGRNPTRHRGLTGQDAGEGQSLLEGEAQTQVPEKVHVTVSGRRPR